jgi:hypothetical protein
MKRIPTGRGGVILLVILGMLALFMLIGVSFVITSTHARSGALATMNLDQNGDSPERTIDMAMLSVVRGSRSPRSVIGPHSILEDMFGERDSVEGVIRYAASDIPAGGTYSNNTFNFPQVTGVSSVTNQDHIHSNGELIPLMAISFGPDRLPGLPGVDDDGNNQVDDNSDAIVRVTAPGQVQGGSDDFWLGNQPPPGTPPGTNMLGMGADAIMGNYAGRLLTMLDGPMARQSTRIVWFYPVESGTTFYWILVIRPFTPGLPSSNNASTTYNTKSALTNHRFVINGRPFNGQGFGYNPTNGTYLAGPNGNYPQLLQSLPANIGNLSHFNLDGNMAESPFPFALLPNPTDRRYRDYLADRSMFTSSPGANGPGSDTLRVNPYALYSDVNLNMNVSRNYTWSPGNGIPSTPGTNPFGVDADEDYDAADYQNLHMAMRVWNPTLGYPSIYGSSVAALPGGPGGRWQTRSPSFHRPELVNYWVQNVQSGNLTNYGISPPSGGTVNWNTILPGGESSSSSIRPRLRQRIILRPDSQDNFDPTMPGTDLNGNGYWDAAEPFTDVNGNGIWDVGEPHAFGNGNSYQQAEPDWSGNPYFNPINGPWDVDNDNDGEPDSIWLDLGAPVQTASDGTQYKPLFAILCLDMDGRLNINAHGNNSHVIYASYSTSTPLGPTQVPMLPVSSGGVSPEAVVLGGKQMWSNRQSIPEPSVHKPAGIYGPFAGGNQQPTSVAVTAAAAPFYTSGTANSSSRSMAVGLGFSVADINLAPLFGPPSTTYQPQGSANVLSYWSEYRFVLQGKSSTGNPNAATTALNGMKPPIPGRYGEPHLLNYKSPLILSSALATGLYGGYSGGGQFVPQAGVTFGQQSTVPDTFDDNVAAPPQAWLLQSPLLANPISIRGNGYQAALPTPYVSAPLSQNWSQNQVGIVSQGAYGSPPDPNGSLMVGLDFRGQPIYANLPHPAINALVDDPWELDLSPKGKRMSYTTNRQSFESDSPFTPGELEALLRYGDPDLGTLQSRPVQIFGMQYGDSQVTTNLRNRVTTESWDLPCPSINPTPEIRRGLQMLGLPTSNCSFADLVRGKIAFVQGLNVSQNPQALALANEQALWLLNGRRVMVGYQKTGTGQTAAAFSRCLPAFSADLLMGLRMNINRTFGNSWDENQNGAIDDPGELSQIGELIWSLPNTSTGVLSDLNNDGVGGMDPTSGFNTYTFPPTSLASSINTGKADLPAFDTMARSELAKHLYMLMMLLTDSDWMYWYPTTQPYLPGLVASTAAAPNNYLTLGTYLNTAPVALAAGVPGSAFWANVINNPPSPASVTSPGATWPALVLGGYQMQLMNARQKMAAYRIAQWAVNAVDFADRDAIMTPFEFDLSPFNIDGYSVDGNPASFVSCWNSFPTQPFTTASFTNSWQFYYEPDRAMIWGMEYPDLLITETTAFHDKGWANTNLEKPINGSHTTPQLNGQGTPPDPDWDQAKLPQGSLFVELYCPGKPNSQMWPTSATNASGLQLPASYQANANSAYLPTELYDVTTPASTYGIGHSAVNNAITNIGTLDLERLTPIAYATRYPVWRLALGGTTVTPRPGTAAATALPGTPALNPGTVAYPTYPSSAVLLTPQGAPVPTANTGYTPVNGQSIQNRFMTRPDTTTIMPLTSLSTHTNKLYSQIQQAVGASVPMVSGNGTTAPRVIDLDSYLVTDFVDTTPANLPNHTVFLQRFVYFARPLSTTVPYYPPYAPNSAMPVAGTLGKPVQTIYQFRHRNSSPQNRLLLHPGSYAVVGPRRSVNSPAITTLEDVTFVGFNPASGGITNWAPQAIDMRTDMPARAYSLLNPVCMLSPINGRAGSPANPAHYGGYPNQNFMTTKIKNPLCIPCASGQPYPFARPTSTTGTYNTRATIAQVDRGLNISEPPQGYITNNLTLKPLIDPTTNNTYKSGNGLSANITDTWSTSNKMLPDQPFDDPNLAPQLNHEAWALQNVANGSGTMSRTLLDYSTVFLQRLADPTRPWDPTNNPYLTIDWMPVDLTIFNGQNVAPGGSTKVGMSDTSFVKVGANYRSGGPSVPADLAFETRQRGPRTNMAAATAFTSYPIAGSLAGPPAFSATAPTTAYYDPGNGHRWPISIWATAPYRFLMPLANTGLSNTAPSPLPAVWPAPSQGNWMTQYTNPYPADSYSHNLYQAVSEAPLWCQMSDDPRYTGTTSNASGVTGGTSTTPGTAVPSPQMGTTTASFTTYLFGTLGFLNEGYGLVDFNYTSASPSPSAIDAPYTGSAYATNQVPFIGRMASANGYSLLTATQVQLQTLYDYVGDPQRPFPWLTWNNRPYSSAMELLLVPASQPARFGWEYTYKTAYTDDWALRPDPLSLPQPSPLPPVPGGVMWDSHYAPQPNPPWGGFRMYPFATVTNKISTGALNYPPQPALNFFTNGGTLLYQTIYNWPTSSSVLFTGHGTFNYLSAANMLAGGYPFGHLLNFFGSNGPVGTNAFVSNLPYNTSGTGMPVDPLVGSIGVDPNQGCIPGNPNTYLTAVQPSSNFHRLFEFVHVPSRFSGTEELMNPAGSAAYAFRPGNPNAANPNSVVSHFLSPHNRVSRYREPGRVNLNTISDTWLKANQPRPAASYTSSLNFPQYFVHQPDIFQGLMNDFPGYQYIWDNLLGGLHVLDARGADKAWGRARDYFSSASQPFNGDDDGTALNSSLSTANSYGFQQSEDQWEAGWPGWQAGSSNGPPLVRLSGNGATDDWIPASSSQPQGLQMLIAGASNERLLNHLCNYTFPEQTAQLPDLPIGSKFGNLPVYNNRNAGLPMPTFFANPFRSFCSGNTVPVPQMLYSWATVPSMNSGVSGMNGNLYGLTTYPMPFYWADSSLFRRSRIHPTRRYEPLFVYNSTNWWSIGDFSSSSYPNPSWDLTPMGNPNFIYPKVFSNAPYPDVISRTAPHLGAHGAQPGEWGEAYRDSNRNPFFRYQPLLKLGNLTTTRSNVYAIWVTVGYFEVRRAKLDPRNPISTFDRTPDGYRLVREMGSDTGDVKRHRGFAIFDRTLPMGFLRGENLNVNDGFLVKRMIE